MSVQNIFKDDDFIESGMNAWNSLSVLLEPEDAKFFTSLEEFKSFYLVVIDKLLSEEVEE